MLLSSLTVIGYGLALAASAWAALCVLWAGGSLGNLALVRGAAALVWLALSIFALRRWDSSLAIPCVAAASLAMGLLLLRVPPKAARSWAADHGRTADVQLDGASVTVESLRSFRHPEDGPAEERWITSTFDLEALVGCDFIVVPFEGRPSLAHTMVSFRFADGPHLAISIEARREVGETYSVLRALFHQYELIYVLGDEEDLIGVRLGVLGDDVYIYPVEGDVALMRAFLVDLLEEAAALHGKPSWYHTLRTNCTTSLVKSFEEATGRSVGFDRRLLAPGHSPEFLQEIGLLDRGVDIETLRRRHRAPRGLRAPWPTGRGSREYSDRIRQGDR